MQFRPHEICPPAKLTGFLQRKAIKKNVQGTPKQLTSFVQRKKVKKEWGRGLPKKKLVLCKEKE